jgi:hypothetical protein
MKLDPIILFSGCSFNFFLYEPTLTCSNVLNLTGLFFAASIWNIVISSPSYLGLTQKVTPALAAKADRLRTNKIAAIQVSDVSWSLALI